MGSHPPTQTIAGHIYLCSPGGVRTTTEVASGTLSATGPQTVASQANPLSPTTVNAGTYLMAASTPTGFLFVDCGGAATPAPDGLTASESLFVPSGATEVGLFYVSAPPVSAGGGTTGPGSVGVPSMPDGPTPTALVPPAAIATGHSPLAKAVPVASTHLAFTGMNSGTPLLLGLSLFAAGLLLLRGGQDPPIDAAVSSFSPGQPPTTDRLGGDPSASISGLCRTVRRSRATCWPTHP